MNRVICNIKSFGFSGLLCFSDCSLACERPHIVHTDVVALQQFHAYSDRCVMYRWKII